MIQRFSDRVVRWLVHVHAVNEDDSELYSFAIHSLLFGLLPLLLVFGWGIVLRMEMQSLLVITPFMCIRKYSGGFHLKSAKLCFAATTCLLGCALLAVRFILLHRLFCALTLAVALSATLIYACSPIDSAARQLSDTERAKFRQMARGIVFIMSEIFTLLLAAGLEQFYVPLGVGIILVAFLQLPCAVKKVFR